MKKIIKNLVTTVCLLGSLSAFAIDLGSAKSDGLVGERADGYVGSIRGGVSAEVRSLVDEVNAKRKAQYQRIAKKNTIPLGDVEALAGKKTIAKTPAGGWIFVENWRRK